MPNPVTAVIVLVHMIARYLSMISNTVLVPGRAVRVFVVGSLLRWSGVEAQFGAYITSGAEISVAKDDERRAASTVLLSVPVMTVIGLVSLAPSLARSVLLGDALVTLGDELHTIVFEMVWDWKRGLAWWIGLACLGAAPLSTSELDVVAQHRRGVISRPAALAARVMRPVELLDAFGRLSISGLWAFGVIRVTSAVCGRYWT